MGSTRCKRGGSLRRGTGRGTNATAALLKPLEARGCILPLAIWAATGTSATPSTSVTAGGGHGAAAGSAAVVDAAHVSTTCPSNLCFRAAAQLELLPPVCWSSLCLLAPGRHPSAPRCHSQPGRELATFALVVPVRLGSVGVAVLHRPNLGRDRDDRRVTRPGF